MMSYFLTVLRHGAGVLSGALTAWIAARTGIVATEDATAQLAELITWLSLGIFLWVYVAVEKALKPAFQRFGEVNDGIRAIDYFTGRRRQ